MIAFAKCEQGRQREEDKRLIIVTPKEETARVARARSTKTFSEYLKDLMYEKRSDMRQVQRKFVDEREQMSAATQKAIIISIIKGVRMICPTSDNYINIVLIIELVTGLAR